MDSLLWNKGGAGQGFGPPASTWTTHESCENSGTGREGTKRMKGKGREGGEDEKFWTPVLKTWRRPCIERSPPTRGFPINLIAANNNSVNFV
jgi:hypothetical protein